jgi:dihydroneopterin aldolase
MRGRILIAGLELRAFHGCFAHERENGQMFEVDLALALDLSEAATSDDLATTIDYGAAVALTETVFCGRKHYLVEAAAFDVARALLDSFRRLESVVIKVVKLTPPIPAKLRGAGVEIEVKRGE